MPVFKPRHHYLTFTMRTDTVCLLWKHKNTAPFTAMFFSTKSHMSTVLHLHMELIYLHTVFWYGSYAGLQRRPIPLHYWLQYSIISPIKQMQYVFYSLDFPVTWANSISLQYYHALLPTSVIHTSGQCCFIKFPQTPQLFVSPDWCYTRCYSI